MPFIKSLTGAQGNKPGSVYAAIHLSKGSRQCISCQPEDQKARARPLQNAFSSYLALLQVEITRFTSLVSVALILTIGESRQPAGITRYPALCSPDFPRLHQARLLCPAMRPSSTARLASLSATLFFSLGICSILSTLSLAINAFIFL